MKYEILDSFYPRVEKKINRICKKCKNLGLPFEFKKIGINYHDITNDYMSVSTYKFIVIDVSGLAAINNYECVAVLEMHDSGNIIKKLNKDIEIPLRFRTSDNVCEHCNTNRNRKNLFVIRNIETNEFKQVGKDCLKLYTGGMSAEAVCYYYDLLIELEENFVINESEPHKRYYSIDEIIKTSAIITSKLGYVKSGNCMSTKSLVYTKLSNKKFGVDNINKLLIGIKSNIRFTEEEFEVDMQEYVDKVKDYYLNIDDTTDFTHNIKVLLNDMYVEKSNIGIICYLHCGYDKYLENIKAKEERKNSTSYFGEIGKRYSNIAFNKFYAVTSYINDYGITYIYKIILEDGSILIWKTQKHIEDCSGNITFTVKNYSEYNGERQTEVSRCKLVCN